MAVITWARPVDPRFESGVDRGVLYIDTNPGVAWNGLIAVDESFHGGERESVRFDGIKHVEYVNTRFFNAQIRAFSSPREFGPCYGQIEIAPGFVITRQSRSPFSMSYRSRVGTEGAYKLHLIYNAQVTPTGRSYLSMGAETTPTEHAWQLDAIPRDVPLMRPTAHFILDSSEMDPSILAVLESYLYGTSRTTPILPTLEMIVGLITTNDVRRLVPGDLVGTATLAASGYSEYDLVRSDVAGIFFELTTSRLYQSELDPAGLNRLEA